MSPNRTIVEYFKDSSPNHCGYCDGYGSISRVTYESMKPISIVENRGFKRGYHCGYCDADNGKSSYGMWAHCLTVTDYQDLIDRGWRRSGKYCYQPLLKETCCAQYAIRCEALNFQLTRSQKKVLKRIKHFLLTGVKPKQRKADVLSQTNVRLEPNLALHRGEISIPKEIQGVDEVVTKSLQNSTNESQLNTSNLKSLSFNEPIKESKGPCKKAKAMRIEKAKFRAKLREDKGLPPVLHKKRENVKKTVEDFVKESLATNASHKLELRLVRASPKNSEFRNTQDESFAVYRKYEMSVHTKSHKDEPVTFDQYLRFLVSSPFEDDEYDDPRFGAFHQQYLLDGKIIAVGVIDVLPRCVSSKYFYYDVDYSFLSMGTYSALREISFVRSLHQTIDSIVYYYLGFYIHSCPKMRYKAKFHPSYLLCPETYTWHSLKICLPRLDTCKYSRFDDTGKDDEDGKVDVNSVLILHQRNMMTFEVYCAKAARRNITPDRQEVQEYASRIGRKCAQRMLLYRQD